MAQPSEELDPLGELADEFLDRLRRGESPSIDEFVDRLPGHREDLRDLLSALIAVESAKPSPEPAPEPVGVRRAAEERPERLGDYRLLREVGRGGMGVVYEAEQISLGRRVALKILAPWLRPGPQQIQRFLREARSAARLHHPDIVPIFAVGEHEGRHYYAMQFISGRGLDHVLEDVRRMRTPTPGASDEAPTRAAALTRFDDGLERATATPPIAGPVPGQAARGSSGSPARGFTDPTSDAPDGPYRRLVAGMVAQVADAVQYAHDQRMLHRDIKPSNLLVDETGKVWVTDFGLVKALDAEDITGTGDLVGTLRYMAPERFRGRCDARSDVYSVGLTLYEMLALRPAFVTGDRHRLIHEITQSAPEAIQRLVPTLPRDLATIVQTAIAPDPGDRYATAGRLADDLRRWLRHEPIKARRSGPLERLGKWARRNPTVAALAATAATAAVAAVTILTIDLARISAALDESRRRLYFQRIALAERSWAGNDVGRAEGMLDEAEPRLRRWEWNFLKRRCHADTATLIANRGEIANALAFSADGSTAATAGKPGEVQLWQASTGKRLQSFHVGGGGVHSLAFGPGGTMIASIGEDRTARVHDSATGKELASLRLSCGEEGLGVAFSPDGALLAACSGTFWETVEHSEAEGELTLWDVRTGQNLRALEGHEGSVHQAVFSPDGSRLASAGGDGRVLVWDPNRVAPVLDLLGHEGTVMGVAWSPDGRRLVSAGLDETLRIWDASTGAALATFRNPGERFLAVAWSPNGLQIAAAGRSWAVTVWDAETGRLVETYRGHDREVIGAAYNHDGRLLGSAGYDGRVRIWDARRSQDSLAITGFGAAVTEVAIDPLGRWVVAAAEGAPLQLREMSTGNPGVALASLTPSHGTVAFSADGSSIASGKRDEPGVVEVWNATDGRSLHTLSAGPAAVTAVALDPVGRVLAAGDARGLVRTWDLRSGEARKLMQARVRRPVTGLVFVEDGRRLAVSTGDVKNVASAGTLTIWDVAAGDVVIETPGHAKGISDLAASPDGRLLATAGWDQQAAVWDARTGVRLGSFHVRGLLIWAVAFTPDGDRLVSADNVGRITFWDVASGSEVLTLPAHSDRIYDLAFSADGRRLISAGRDGVVKIWDGAPPASDEASVKIH